MRNDQFGMGHALQERKLRRVALWARWLADAGMVAMVSYGCFLLFDQDALVAFLKTQVPDGSVINLPSTGRLWLAYGFCLVPAGLFLGAMWETRRLFVLLGHSRLIDSKAPPILVRLGYLAFGIAVAEIVTRTLVILAMTSANPPGQRQLAIGISGADVGSVIAGLLFLAFALVMQEALRLEDENRDFV